MIQLSMIGRLTKDAEVRTNNNGGQFVVFTVATQKGYGEKAETLFIDCTVGGTLVNALSKATKGSLVFVTGECSLNIYQKNDGNPGAKLKCLVSSFNFIPTGKKEDGQGQQPQGQPQHNVGYQQQPQQPYNNGYQQQSQPYNNGTNGHQQQQPQQPYNNGYQQQQQPYNNGTNGQQQPQQQRTQQQPYNNGYQQQSPQNYYEELPVDGGDLPF